MNESGKPHIFISYKSEEHDYVESLAQTLRAHGYPVWRDTDSIPGSAMWEEEIRTAIEHAQAVIALITADGESSRWIQRELLFAEKLRKPIIPLQRSGEIWFRLADIQAIDARNATLADPAPPRLYEALDRLYAEAPPKRPVTNAPKVPATSRPLVWALLIAAVLIVVLILGTALSYPSIEAKQTESANLASSATLLKQTQDEFGGTATINVAVSATFYSRTQAARNAIIQKQIDDRTQVFRPSATPTPH